MTYRLSLNGAPVQADTLKGVSDLFVTARELHGWTANDLRTPIQVFNDKGEHVAEVSYNGRVWRRYSDWRYGAKPLYDPLPPVPLELQFWRPRE